MITLRPHQQKAVDQLSNGKILCGGVGSGKTPTSLVYWYTKVMGGVVGDMSSIRRPVDLVVITTAKKRDSLDWEADAAKLGIGRDPETSYGGITITVDSWNNISKYETRRDCFFIFDEQRLVGSGSWVKSFIKIAAENQWILLSATPGDTWIEYIPVFLANGFYKNRTEFINRHVVYVPRVKFPKVQRYTEVTRLVRLRNQILVDMPYERHTNRITNFIQVDYDQKLFDRVVKKRWHVYEDRPLRDVGEMFICMRKVANSDASRLASVRALMEKHDRLIVFYNFDYELAALRTLRGYWTDDEGDGEKWIEPNRGTARVRSVSEAGKETNDTQVYVGRPSKWGNPYVIGKDGSREEVIEKYRNYILSSSLMNDLDELRDKDLVCWCAPEACHADVLLELANPELVVAEWNGHKHEPVPTSKKWVYLVQYTAGAEGWNCIETDAMVFYSLTYSYKIFEQAMGRIDRLNTPFTDLYYFVLRGSSLIDRAIWGSLSKKKSFTESSFAGVRKEDFRSAEIASDEELPAAA